MENGYLKGIVEKEDFIMTYAPIRDKEHEWLVTGEERANLKTATKMLALGYTVEDISKITELPIEELKKLQSQQRKTTDTTLTPSNAFTNKK